MLAHLKLLDKYINFILGTYLQSGHPHALYNIDTVHTVKLSTTF